MGFSLFYCCDVARVYGGRVAAKGFADVCGGGFRRNGRKEEIGETGPLPVLEKFPNSNGGKKKKKKRYSALRLAVGLTQRLHRRVDCLFVIAARTYSTPRLNFDMMSAEGHDTFVCQIRAVAEVKMYIPPSNDLPEQKSFEKACAIVIHLRAVIEGQKL
jgi:hypothetical protein